MGGVYEAFDRELEERGHVPKVLSKYVKAAEAKERYARLREFHAAHGHWLVTNGPYQLKSWSPEATVLEVFRDMSYPLGVGSYDAYATPRRAYITGIEARGGGLTVSAEIEKVEKFARSYRIVREAVSGRRALKDDTLECRYLVIGADGAVARTSLGRLQDDGSFRIDLDHTGLPHVQYTVVVALTLNGNTVDPDIRTISYEVH